MKVNPWLIPTIAALASGGWMISQKRSSATLEREITVINGRIREVRALEDEERKSRAAEETARKDKERRIDWKDMAGKVARMQDGGMPDMREFMRLQRILMDMSAEDLRANLDEIAKLDLDPQTLQMLRGLLVGALTEKDPQQALEHFAAGPADAEDGMHWQMGGALGQWAKKDPAAAAAWLDKQIAAGKFESKSLDGKSESRISLERSLIAALLDSSPATATARVKALPEVQREELFHSGMSYQLNKGNQEPYATMVRETMPAGKVGGILADAASSLVRQGGDAGYGRVNEFIATTRASDAEKNEIVTSVMQSQLRRHGQTIKPEDIDKAREWAAGHAPEAVDKATGEALAQGFWNGGKIEETTKLVMKYHAASDNDDTLASFLKNGSVTSRNTAAVRALIDEIRDPAVREEILALPQFKTSEEP